MNTLLAISMTVVVFGLIVFVAILMLLVALIIVAAKKMVQQGDVKITINEEKTISVPAGGSLLTTLSSEGIYLPSACGGKGTCAECKCQVHEGGGSILPTETGHIKRKAQAEDWRLSCQVKVKNDLKITVPDEVFGIKKWECEVVSNYNVASFIKEFVVRLPPGEHLNFKAGGYVQVDVPEIEVNYKDIDITSHPRMGKPADEFQSEWDKFKLWDLKMKNDEPIFRAYSMANHPAEGDIVMLNIRIATPPWDRAKGGWMDVNPGVCSSYVFSKKPGDKVTISGPYGEFFIKDTKAEMIYVGGGAGMAPLRSHLFHLFHTLKTTDRKVSFWYGGRSKRELFYIDDFKEIEKQYPNFRFYLVLSEPLPEDNWKVKKDLDDEGDGFVGFVHQALIDNYLDKHKAPEDIEFYFCGPPMMNAAVEKMTEDYGVPPENVAFDDFG